VFGLASFVEERTYAVRRCIPPLSTSQLRRVSPQLNQLHNALLELVAVFDDEDRRVPVRPPLDARRPSTGSSTGSSRTKPHKGPSRASSKPQKPTSQARKSTQRTRRPPDPDHSSTGSAKVSSVDKPIGDNPKYCLAHPDHTVRAAAAGTSFA
jgi:hypothetical protein